MTAGCIPEKIAVAVVIVVFDVGAVGTGSISLPWLLGLERTMIM